MSWVMYKLETISQYKIVKLYVSMLQNIEEKYVEYDIIFKTCKAIF